MKVLFLGGTGLIGSAVGARLTQDKANKLTIVHRGGTASSVTGGNVRELRADLRNPEELRGILNDERFDVVVNWIAFSTDHVQQDIDFFRGNVGQYFFISSASAYQKPLQHYRITESTPLVNPYWEYSRNKAACERLLENSDIPYTVVRPSHTYGQGKIPFPIGSGKDWTPVQRILDGKPIIVPGDGTSLWTTTYNTDFAEGMVGLFGQNRAIGQAFHITSDEAITWNNLVNTVGQALGVTPKLIHLPSELIEKKLPGQRGGLLGDKSESVIFDNSKLKDFVPGFKAKVTFAEGVRKCLEYCDTHEKEIDDQYNKDMDILTELHAKIYAL
ncbi:hypothetical protein FACS1894202_12300 [Clostridia bacterium]|nr:hypothetical protein FACS1894202_12300 [Clostridia bacterium]